MRATKRSLNPWSRVSNPRESRTIGAQCGKSCAQYRLITQTSTPRSLDRVERQERVREMPISFFTHRSSHRGGLGGVGGNVPDPADIGRTIQVLTTRLPHLLKEGPLPQDILSETITLEVLPSTLGLPEIKGKTAYTTLVKLGTWSITTLLPKAILIVDAQKLIGSARNCEKLKVKFRLVDDSNKTLYTGLFHFHFDSNGKVSRHIFEIVDDGYSPSLFVNWLVGARNQEKTLGYCYERYDKK